MSLQRAALLLATTLLACALMAAPAAQVRAG